MNKTIANKIMNRESLTHAEKQQFIRESITIHNPDGKMADFMSISTSAMCNTHCAIRQHENNTVCSHCYAKRMLKRYPTLNKKMAVNHVFYTEYTIESVDVPLINASVFRFESFGELNNETQLLNYFTIAKKNCHCTFAIWTKNPWIIDNVIQQGHSKPDNLIIVLSSLFLNKPEYRPTGGIFDKIFTVYTDSYTKTNNISINCGGKSCRDCMKCYTKTDTTRYINELLK